MGRMKILTVNVNEDQIELIDQMVLLGSATSRSEFIRQAIYEYLQKDKIWHEYLQDRIMELQGIISAPEPVIVNGHVYKIPEQLKKT